MKGCTRHTGIYCSPEEEFFLEEDPENEGFGGRVESESRELGTKPDSCQRVSFVYKFLEIYSPLFLLLSP